MNLTKKIILVLFGFCCIGCACFSANTSAEEFKAKIKAAIQVGAPADEVRKFLKSEGLRIKEFPNPKAISTSIRYDKTVIGYKATVGSFLLDENDRVKEIVFNDDTVGL